MNCRQCTSRRGDWSRTLSARMPRRGRLFPVEETERRQGKLGLDISLSLCIAVFVHAYMVVVPTGLRGGPCQRCIRCPGSAPAAMAAEHRDEPEPRHQKAGQRTNRDAHELHDCRRHVSRLATLPPSVDRHCFEPVPGDSLCCYSVTVRLRRILACYLLPDRVTVAALDICTIRSESLDMTRSIKYKCCCTSCVSLSGLSW